MIWFKARARLTRALRVVGLVGMVVGAPGDTPVRAQAPQVQPQMEEVDPLNCWWRTSVSAITVGQPFTLVLTCAIVEAETTAAVVDRARLDPRAIELAPFEVLGGTVAPDVKAGDRTFFQVQYNLRFINEAFFSQDIALPPLAISYRIQTRGSGQDAATLGMERRFAMPNQTLRVNSLVPADATDIRDASTMTFADLDVMSSRARLLTTGGAMVLGLAGVLVLVGLARGIGSRVRRPTVATRLLSEASMLRGAARALGAVARRRQGAGPWSADDLAEALAATRIVGECAIDRAPSQRLAGPGEPIPTGAIGVRTRFGTGPVVVVSGTVTSKALGPIPAHPSRASRSARLTAIQQALATFTAAQYADSGPRDEVALDETLSTVKGIARRLSLERTWLMQRLTLRAWRQLMERPAL
ncbi:MAG: hypothetical protein FJW27_12595 [Acidimicrobiia bacterium]|nr:hypothetical protein [Acidimicrobiia bacterium]